MWKEAEGLYRAALLLAPSYQNMIKLGRSLGFQGMYPEAAAEYGRLFDSEPIIESGSNPAKFNSSLRRQKPELYLAYLEWGVAAQLAAAKSQDAEMYLRADTIFANIVRTPDPTAKIFWQAKLHQIQNLMGQGKYRDAGLVMRDVERNNTDLGAPAGLQAEFKKLKDEIAKKDLDHQAPRQPPAPDPAKAPSGTNGKEGSPKEGGK
jgi:hypothetical protein